MKQTVQLGGAGLAVLGHTLAVLAVPGRKTSEAVAVLAGHTNNSRCGTMQGAHRRLAGHGDCVRHWQGLQHLSSIAFAALAHRGDLVPRVGGASVFSSCQCMLYVWQVLLGLMHHMNARVLRRVISLHVLLHAMLLSCLIPRFSLGISV